MNISKQAIEAGARAIARTYSGHEQDYARWINHSSACLTAAIPHLRGEGKAEASTPTSKESLQVEPNPDDVERVAMAMFEQHGRKCSWKVGWDGQEEGTKDAYREQATAAIRAMNGQLWGVWAGGSGWLTVPQKPNKDFVTHDQDNAALIVLLAKQLNPGYGYEVRPYTAPREESAEEIAKRELQDIADNGLRCDTNPTIQITTSANDTAFRYVQYIRQIDSTMRDRAKSALEAIREAEKRGAAKCG